MNFNKIPVDKTWSLFLDRDGVINKRIVGDYVTSWQEFEFLPGVLSTLAKLASVFDRIFIVTNQQGVGKGIMTKLQLLDIHNKMLQEIVTHNGRIDFVYFCTDLDNSNSLNRKPEIGMALKARVEFPKVDFTKSIMIGDSSSDIEFGKNAGMITILCNNETTEYKGVNPDYHINHFSDLLNVLKM